MNPDLVRNYLTGLQDRLCATFEAVDGQAKFITDEWQRAEGGGGRTRVIAGGAVIEKGAVAFGVTSTQAPLACAAASAVPCAAVALAHGALLLAMPCRR